VCGINAYGKYSVIRIGTNINAWFQQLIGVRQGFIFSSDQFEHTMREAMEGMESNGARQNDQQLTFC